MFRKVAHLANSLPLTVIVLLSLPVLGDVASASQQDACAQAIPLELGSSNRTFGDTNETQFFSVDVPTSGYLVLEALAPVVQAAQPKLGFLGRSCGGNRRAWTFPQQFLSGLVVRVARPGIYHFRVASQDPGQRLADYKVEVAFLPFEGAFDSIKAAVTTELTGEPPPTGSGDEGGSTSSDVPPGFSSKTTEGGSTSSDVPPGLLFDGESNYFRGCMIDDLDDHGDGFFCATPLRLGEAVSGELENGWGDDVDTLSFDLEAQRTVRIMAVGEDALEGALYDENGYRLGTSDDLSRGLVTTLRPGRYFVRVESAQGGGRYSLVVEAVSGW